jgi:sec-independent protein translocase protein TatA
LGIASLSASNRTEAKNPWIERRLPPVGSHGGIMEGLFQPLHILLIVGIALLLFGPSKFADLGKGLGEGIKNFKSAVKDEPKKDKDEEKKS